jgi:hypothetical protein
MDGTIGTKHALAFSRSVTFGDKSLDIVKTLALVVVALLCIIALVTPVGANMLFRGGLAGSGVTDPGALTLLGASLVTVGVWTRRVLFSKRGPGRKSP